MRNITNLKEINAVLKRCKPSNDYEDTIKQSSIDIKIEKDCKNMITELYNSHYLDNSNNFFTTQNSINKIKL